MVAAAAVAATTAAASVAGAAMQASAAGSAADTQAASANNATQAQLSMFNQTQKNLQPFIQPGAGIASFLPSLIGINPGTATPPPGAPAGAMAYYINPQTGAGAMENSPGVWTDYGGNPAGQGNAIFAGGVVPTQGNAGTPGMPSINPNGPFSPITPNLATIAQTPGYQFNLYQGLKSTQNAASARGLGVSGAALKGAANYATGLADSTYQNQFDNLVTNQNNLFSRIFGVSNLGENAAAGLGNLATQTGQSIGSNMIGAGNAMAAGQIGSANAIAGGLTGATGNAQNLLLFNALLKNGGGQGLFGSGN